MFIAQARDVYLLRFIAEASIGEKLSRFKIAAQTSMTFAGKFFTEEIAPNKFPEIQDNIRSFKLYSHYTKRKKTMLKSTRCLLWFQNSRKMK